MEPIKQNFFDEGHEITSEMGFNVAFGIINYDTTSSASFGDQYGQVKMYERIWGQVDETTGEIIATHMKEVETEPCKTTFFPRSDSEYNPETHRFYPLNENS